MVLFRKFSFLGTLHGTDVLFVLRTQKQKSVSAVFYYFATSIRMFGALYLVWTIHRLCGVNRNAVHQQNINIASILGHLSFTFDVESSFKSLISYG